MDSHLESLQTELTQAQNQWESLTVQLVREGNSLLSSTRGLGPPAPDGPDRTTLSSSGRIQVNNACQHYIQYLVSLEEVISQTEKLVRASQHSLKLERGRTHLENISNAVGTVSQCEGYLNALTQLEDRVRGVDASNIDVASVVQLMCTLSHPVVSRVREATKGTRAVLSATMQHYLRDCSWPPPLLPSASGEGQWAGFEEAGDAVFGELQELIVMMLDMQLATQQAEFASMDERTAQSIELWPATEFADAINSWIASHFSPGMATCKIERPEWLFSAVYHAVRSCAEQVDVFESCIQARGIHQFFSMPVEVAKSVYRRGLRLVVRSVYVPLLFEEEDGSYVLHFVDEVIKFEDKFRPLRTDPLLAAARAGPAPIDGSLLLDILFEDDSWRSRWLQLETEEARQRIWMDYASTEGWAGDDTEFRPSHMVRHALKTLEDLLTKTGYISSGDDRLLWCRTVVSGAIETVKAHLQSEVSRAEQFDHLTDKVGIPVISACLNDLHYLEHTLREPYGDLMDAISSSPELLLPFLEQQAAAVSTLRRKWTNKIVESAMDVVLSGFQAVGKNTDEVSGQISRLLDEFSMHMDQVSFTELWKGVTRSVNDAWLQLMRDEDTSPTMESLNTLVSAFAGYTSKPQAYFRDCFAS